ncbi:MAG: ribosomal-processing cysteine protease Prp [Clostridia bacterium]|nr:ribosomal-processing cysteine protease Prp [Oscillospiraceae bacterium]MDY5627892.1 ribosomal-processing cysteine protease Prp [Clostridia bacterium]
MTNIKIYRDKNKNIVKAEFDGHAHFSDENDIVCSALSAVSYMTANGIENVAGIKVGYETDNGYLYFVLPCDIEEKKREKANVLLESMYLFLTDLQKQYSDCISISDLEV